MPKIDRAHKNHLTPEIWEETHLREIFYGTLIFQQSSMILYWLPCWKAYSCLPPVNFIIFSTIFLKLKYKISVQKEVIHSFKNHILVTWPATNLLILRKWCRFAKPNHYLFKIWPTNRFLKKKSYNFHFHKNDVTWPLSANGLLSRPVLFVSSSQALPRSTR